MNNETTLQQTILKISELNNLVAKIVEEKQASEQCKAETNSAPEMLTIKETIKTFPYLSDFTLRKWIREGKIKSHKIGDGKNGKYIINKSDLQKMFE